VAGKTLAFVMGPNPCTWGTGADFQAPAQSIPGLPLTSPWIASLGNPVIADATTASPVWGNGQNGADNSAIHAAFPTTTLALPGQKITLSATVAFRGLSSPQASTAQRFAWGFFHDAGTSPTAWPGYLAANDTATTTQNLWRKATGGSDPYHSTTAATALSSFSLATPDFADGTYRLLLTLTRNANGALDYYAALVRSADGLLFAAFTGSDPSPTTFSFNRVGLRAGAALDADAITLSDLAIVTDAVHSVSLTATDDNAGEFGADQALVFTVSRSGSTAAPLNVLLTASGTASSADFSGFLATVLIPAGAATADLALTVLPDALAEGAETLTLTLVPNAAYFIGSPSSDDATIADRPDQAAYSAEIADPAKRGQADDGDGDGTANSIERFMGSLVGDPSSNGKVEVLEPTPGTFKVRYPRAKNRPELTGSLRWSSDLITWRNSGETDGTLTVTFAESVISAPGADPEMLEATVVITGGSAAKTFVHLRVE
jgi:hypothetical protein